MIIPEFNAAFIHVPKAAGKSITHMLLSDLLGHETSGAISGQPDKVKEKYLLRSPPERHAPASAYSQSYKFAVVRNPYDRLVSVYKWHVRTRNFKHNPPSFEQFLDQTEQRLVSEEPVPWQDDPVWFHVQPQTYYVDSTVNDILKCETISIDINRVRERLNIKQKLEWHHKSKPIQQTEFYDNTNLLRVTKWYEDDFDSFGYNKNELSRMF